MTVGSLRYFTMFIGIKKF